MVGLEKLTARSGYIRLLGLPFSRVASVGVILDDTLRNDLEEPGKSHPVLDWWNEVLQNQISGSIEGINAMMSMAMALTAGWDEGYTLVANFDEQEDQLRYFADYLAMIDHLFRITGQENTTSFTPLDMALYEGDREQFELAAWRVCDGRRLFRVENGAYGIGPACMQNGDTAVILSGGEIPYILREADQGFLYMGEAYIDEIMTGKLVEDLRAGKTQLQEYFLR
jgi:hypothetical protein